MIGTSVSCGRRAHHDGIEAPRPAWGRDRGAMVTEADLAPLPEPVRRYLRFMRVVGHPRDWSFRMESAGRFRMRPDGRWMDCEAWQYNSCFKVSRTFLMRMRLGGWIPMRARDTYVGGRGRMVGKLLGLITVVDGRGEELDRGELVTWLNDAVLIAPSMLLGPETRWSKVGADAFEVAFTDCGRTVKACVTVDDRGAPRGFSTMDRFRYDADRPGARWAHERWSTPVAGWQMVGSRPVYTRGSAIWHLPQGHFVYAEFRPRLETLAFNVIPPGD